MIIGAADMLLAATAMPGSPLGVIHGTRDLQAIASGDAFFLNLHLQDLDGDIQVRQIVLA